MPHFFFHYWNVLCLMPAVAVHKGKKKSMPTWIETCHLSTPLKNPYFSWPFHSWNMHTTSPSLKSYKLHRTRPHTLHYNFSKHSTPTPAPSTPSKNHVFWRRSSSKTPAPVWRRSSSRPFLASQTCSPSPHHSNLICVSPVFWLFVT